MTETLTIRAVRSDADLDAVKALCVDFLHWNRARYAHLEWLIDRYYDPLNWAAYLSDLSRHYAPPLGEILLARLGVDAVGCVMMRPVDRRTCEMKHLFVAAGMRGQNVGSRLCDALMTLAVHRGFHAMRLETGCENEEAIALYRRLGFSPCAPSAEYPDEVRALLRFMRADLTSRVRAH